MQLMQLTVQLPHLYLVFDRRVMIGFLDPLNIKYTIFLLIFLSLFANLKWINIMHMKRTAEDTDALVVASASPLSFESWCERFLESVLSSDSRGERGVVNGVPGCLCNWPSCVWTCVACFCSSAAAAAASLCFFSSDWLCRSWARISRSNWRASRASRSLYTPREKNQKTQHVYEIWIQKWNNDIF